MNNRIYTPAQHEATLLILRGIAAILFGVAALFWPGLTTLGLVYLFSAFVIATGVITLIDSLTHLYHRGRKSGVRALLALVGIAEIGVGIFLVRHTTVSLQVLTILIALVLVIRGALEIAGSLLERQHFARCAFVAIAGLLAVAIGLLLLFRPAPASVAFVWVLGLYALISGPILIAIGLAIRHALRRPAYRTPPDAPPETKQIGTE